MSSALESSSNWQLHTNWLNLVLLLSADNAAWPVNFSRKRSSQIVLEFDHHFSKGVCKLYDQQTSEPSDVCPEDSYIAVWPIRCLSVCQWSLAAFHFISKPTERGSATDDIVLIAPAVHQQGIVCICTSSFMLLQSSASTTRWSTHISKWALILRCTSSEHIVLKILRSLPAALKLQR